MTHRLHYARSTPVDSRWRGQPCRVLARAKGPGPRNVLVETEAGCVVVPARNVKKGGNVNVATDE